MASTISNSFVSSNSSVCSNTLELSNLFVSSIFSTLSKFFISSVLSVTFKSLTISKSWLSIFFSKWRTSSKVFLLSFDKSCFFSSISSLLSIVSPLSLFLVFLFIRNPVLIS